MMACFALPISAASNASDAPVPCEKGNGVRDCTEPFDIGKHQAFGCCLRPPGNLCWNLKLLLILFCIPECAEVLPTYESPEAFKACNDRCEKAKKGCRELAAKDVLAAPFKTCLMSQLSGIEFYSTCRFSEKQRMGKTNIASSQLISSLGLRSCRQLPCKVHIVLPKPATSRISGASAVGGVVRDTRRATIHTCVLARFSGCRAADVLQAKLYQNRQSRQPAQVPD